MRIIIDISHPAHVHLFKNVAIKMLANKHEVLFTTREKDCTIALLDYYQFNYICFGKNFKSFIGKLWGMLYFTFKLLKVSKTFNPDLLISHTSVYASLTSFIINKPHITLDDTGNNEQLLFAKLFAKVIITPDCHHKNLGKKQIKYKGYHELAYLHPNNFTPSLEVLSKYNIDKDIKFVIVRIVSWNASHDIGMKGINSRELEMLIKTISVYAKIYISSEIPLSENYKSLELNILPQDIHHILAYATLYFGEGASMASECAMLGTPVIYTNKAMAGTILEQQKYGLLFWIKDFSEALNKVVELLNTPNLKEVFLKKKNIMISEKIDVSSFLEGFLEDNQKNYSFIKMSKNNS